MTTDRELLIEAENALRALVLDETADIAGTVLWARDLTDRIRQHVSDEPDDDDGYPEAADRAGFLATAWGYGDDRSRRLESDQ